MFTKNVRINFIFFMQNFGLKLMANGQWSMVLSKYFNVLCILLFRIKHQMQRNYLILFEMTEPRRNFENLNSALTERN